MLPLFCPEIVYLYSLFTNQPRHFDKQPIKECTNLFDSVSQAILFFSSGILRLRQSAEGAAKNTCNAHVSTLPVTRLEEAGSGMKTGYAPIWLKS